MSKRQIVSKQENPNVTGLSSSCSFSPGLTAPNYSNETIINKIQNQYGTEEICKEPKHTAVQNNHTFNKVVDEFLTREEIKALRKEKVSALRQRKKREKQQKESQSEQMATPAAIFNLDQVAEEFPTLGAAKKNKKPQKIEIFENIENKTCIESNIDDKTFSKTFDKSWKPKVKDPICIDLGFALQAKPEKCKLVTKKINQNAQKQNLIGNILDSDNPQRKKGKVRLNKVQKPTKLKAQILSERNERQKMHLVEDSVENSNASENISLVGHNQINETYYIQPFNKVDDRNINTSTSSDNETTDQGNSDTKCQTDNIYEKLNIHVNEQKSTASMSIHSRKFREYCSNCLTVDVISGVCQLLEKVTHFQDRIFAKDPIKANAKRRYVAGLNQSKKYLMVKKVKLLVIAPDLERNAGEGGLDDKINLLKNEAESQGIPCVFGPNRKRLGKAVMKKSLVSCVAVISYDGAEEQFAKVLEALEDAQSKYNTLVNQYQETTIDPGEENSNNLSVPERVMAAEEVTSSLLAALRDETPAAEKLLNAIQCLTLVR